MQEPEVDNLPLGALLAHSGRLQRELARAKMADMGLHRGQFWYLGALASEDGQMQSRLAARLQVQPATVSNSLQRMERDGLVSRRPDPDDQRVSRVYLTEQGRATYERVHGMWRDFEEQLFARLSTQDKADLARMLRQVLENLGIDPTDLAHGRLGHVHDTRSDRCATCGKHREKGKGS